MLQQFIEASIEIGVMMAACGVWLIVFLIGTVIGFKIGNMIGHLFGRFLK